MIHSWTRRKFIRSASLAATGLAVGAAATATSYTRKDKLNLAFVGVGGMQGGYNLDQFAPLQENIVALCDVDGDYLRAAARKFPNAQTYRDFRRLLDQRDIDAVVVTTPDHTHAVIAAAALRRGKHVYCEKPLTHTVSEARVLAELARRHHCVTQMGTQIHAGANYRRVAELIQKGAIGIVNEVHVWHGGSWEEKMRPPGEEVPPTLDYDLWLGPAQRRPYSTEYVPINWRRWWAFGGGTLADFGCHFMDLAFWALDLRYPATIEAEGPPVHPECAPPWLIVRYEFPGQRTSALVPSIKLTWYHGGKRPPHPEAQKPEWGAGLLFVGTKGKLFADYGQHKLLPEQDFAGIVPPQPFIPDSIGHYKEWTEACKRGYENGVTTCNFNYAGPLTETVNLGLVAYRVGKKLEWDAARLHARNAPEADPYIHHRYRRDWKV